MGDADTRDVVLITESRYRDGRPISEPGRVSDTDASPTFTEVWVGNDQDGWRRVPRVTSIVMDLKQSEVRKAVITVLFPRVEFEGGPPRPSQRSESS